MRVRDALVALPFTNILRFLIEKILTLCGGGCYIIQYSRAAWSGLPALRRAAFQRYLDEFTFRFNNRSKLGVEDGERAEKLTKGMEGKRLTYRRIAGQGESLEGLAVQGELFPRPPARRFVTLDTVEYVARPKEGGVVVVGRRGAAEVHIKVSDLGLAELVARLRRPT